MRDLKERLDALAGEGSPRGATAVMDAARHSLEGAPPLGAPVVPQTSSRRQVVVAFAVVLVIALVVSAVLILRGDIDRASRVVPVVPEVNDLRDLFVSTDAPTPATGTTFLVPGYIPAGMQPLRVTGGYLPGVVVPSGSSDANRSQLWVKLDPAGDRPVDSFVLSWGPGATAPHAGLPEDIFPKTNDPLFGMRAGAAPTVVRGHDGVYQAKFHQLAWEEPEGQMISIYGMSLSHQDMIEIADGLQTRDGGRIAVTQAPPGFLQVSESAGAGSVGTNERDVIYRDRAGAGFRVEVVDAPGSSPGQNLTVLPPHHENDPRVIDVRGHHAVLAKQLVSSGGGLDQEALFLQGADTFVQWLEPGNVMVTVSAKGLREPEVLSIARGLRNVDAAGWDQLLVRAPGRTGAAPTPRTATPPTFTGEAAAVVGAYRAWLDATKGSSDDATAVAIEDGESLRATFAKLRTSTAAVGVSGRVDAVRLVDSDHALVTFSIVTGAGSTLNDQQGGAVRVNGRWVVSRATYCSIVALIGIKCPAP